MLLYGDSNETAIERYRNIKFLTSVIITGLETLIEKAIGLRELAGLKRDIE
jgi:hypothetical protein